jgi:TonB-linked SusC/RagA family outer membrane protein
MKKLSLIRRLLKIQDVPKLFLVMKLTFLLSLFFTFSTMAEVYSQEARLTLNMQGASLEEVLETIEKESGYEFFYHVDRLNLNKSISIKVNDATIENVLKQILDDGEVDYRIIDMNIILTEPQHVLASESQQVKREVKGRVIDLSGEALPGVNVFIKGTTAGTITSIDGTYSITVEEENAVLVFSFIGFENQEVAVTDRNEINITLVEDVMGIDEVVVVGYGVQQKKTLTGAIGTVKSEDMVQRPAANTTELLQGQVAGLITRQQSGLPGADGTTLNIRGYGNPLVLVDGMESSLANVDPNDIENVSVLKDASAAIYGARAGNGVILVTTKRGSKDATRITYHGNVSFTQPTYLPDRVGAAKWAEMLHESGLLVEDYTPNHVTYDPETKELTNTLDGSLYHGYDWSDALMRDWTPQQQHNINASGGSEKVKYFVSVGFTDQASNFKSGDYNFNRYNVRSNIDANITDNLGVSVDFVYRKNILDKANFDVSDMYNSLQTAKPVYPIVHEADPTRATFSGFLQRSPYHQTFKEFSGWQKNQTNALQGNIELRYDFPMVQGLTAKAKLSYEDIFLLNKRVSKPFEVWEHDPTVAEGEDPWIHRGIQNTNNMRVYSERSAELMPTLSVEYERAFGDHGFKAIFLNETRTYRVDELEGTRKDLLSFEAPYLRYASKEGMENDEIMREQARTAYVGRVNYDYRGKYMAQFTLRADASGEYPPEGRWGYFPSVSAGWRISEESFMDNVDLLNNLKLRASYGVLGKDEASSFDYLTGYLIQEGIYVFGNSPAPIISSAGLANPNVTWETMTMYNVGLDVTMWNGLLGLELDAFYRLREDILTTPTSQVPSTFGASLPRTNYEKRDNRGFEIMLNHQHRFGDFSYSVSPIFSWSRGKYVTVDEVVDEDDPVYNEHFVKAGRWDDEKWGLLSDGFFMNQEEIDNHPIDQDQHGNEFIKVGDIKYKDLNGDNFIDWRDEAIIGASGLPNIMYGLKMSANYRGVGLYMLFQGAADYLVTFSGSAASPFSNESIPLEEHYTHRMILGLDENNSPYITNPGAKLPPVTMNGRTSNNSKASDFWNYDARYLRLKNLNVSYTLPKRWMEPAGIQNCVLYLSGTNLWTISNLGIFKDSFDPEIIGQDGRDYPPVKTLTLGLRLTL